MPTLNVNSLKIYYEEGGVDEITLVCLHGISSNSRSWRHQLAGLSNHYRVIAWDVPGYGQSDDPPNPMTMTDYADYLAGLLDKLELTQVVVVGLSMGGVLAQEFYRQHSERVLALILADTNCGGGARPAAERKTRLEARLKVIDTMSPAEIARDRGPALLSPEAPPELIAEVIEMVSQIHPVGYRYAAIALDGSDTRAVLPTITVPTLILWAAEDTITPRPEAEAIYQAVPNSEFAIIAGAGHLSNLEQPEIFNAAVRTFVEKLGGQDK